jgi:hypothetical protein
MSKPHGLNAFWMRAGPGFVLALVIWGCEESGDSLSVQRGSAALARASTSTTVIQEPFESTEFLDLCVNNGEGEFIQFTGSFKEVVHITTNRGCCEGGGAQHFIDNGTIHAEGVGLSTGTIYRLNNNQAFRVQGESPTEPFPATLQFIVTRPFIVNGQGVVAVFKLRQHLTINANGEVTVDSFDIELACK